MSSKMRNPSKHVAQEKTCNISNLPQNNTSELIELSTSITLPLNETITRSAPKVGCILDMDASQLKNDDIYYVRGKECYFKQEIAISKCFDPEIKYIIVHFISGSKHLFTYFDSYENLMKYIKSFSPNQVSFDEIILNNLPQKPNFEINTPKDQERLATELQTIIIDKCIENFKSKSISINIDDDILIYLDITNDLYKIFIVINNKYHSNAQEAEAFYKEIIESIPKCYKDYIKSDYLHINRQRPICIPNGKLLLRRSFKCQNELRIHNREDTIDNLSLKLLVTNTSECEQLLICESKEQKQCKKSLEELYNKPFTQERSNWLINPETEYWFKLDYYEFPYIDESEELSKEPSKEPSKGQRECREILEDLYNKPFTQQRPDWLINPETGYSLELDCYNVQLGIAIEYNGEQHYSFPNGIQKTRSEFDAQQRRDKYKIKLCEEKINLIIVPYTSRTISEKKKFIIQQLSDLKLLP